MGTLLIWLNQQCPPYTAGPKTRAPVDTPRVQQQIETGLSALHFADAPRLAPKLVEYLELLARWNQAYNLTAVRAPDEMVSRHLMDSLVVLPFIDQARVLDVGTGAGLPGLVLAIASPAQRFVLLDSAAKKTRFVAHAVTRLGLQNVDVVTARVEAHQDAQGFDVVISRAFSAVAEFVRVAGHLVRRGGRMLAMKGGFPEAELAALPGDWRLLAAHKLVVPGLEARRHLLELCPQDAGT